MSKKLSNVGSYGWGGAFSTTYWVDPKANLIALLMTQLRLALSGMSYRGNLSGGVPKFEVRF